MPHWAYTLDVRAIWKDFQNGAGFEMSRDAIVEKILKSRFYDEEDYGLVNRITDLELAEDLEEFNWAWNEFYDWCDYARVWVKTS